MILPPPLPTDEPPPDAEALGDVVMAPCTAPDQAMSFPNFWAGDSFDGLSVTAVLRRCDLPVEDEPIRTNYVSYIYGDCTPGDDEGCAPPIEIQSWSAQELNKTSLTPGPGETSVGGTDTAINGVPATWYEDGYRLEIYRADTTILIFGDDNSQIERFGRALIAGPDILADLAGYGIVFDTKCVSNIHYCVADTRPF